MSRAVSRTSLADSCHPRPSMSSALRSARQAGFDVPFHGLQLGNAVLRDLRHSDTLATTEYERLDEKRHLEKSYLQTVKNQEKAPAKGEGVKATIRARSGEMDRRLAWIGGV